MAEGEKKIPRMLIVGLLVGALALAGGISYYIATTAVSSQKEHKASYEPGVLVKIGDEKDGLVLNIGGVNSGRYLKISIVLELIPLKAAADAPASAGKSLSPEEVILLDTTVNALRSRKLDEFDPNNQDRLKEYLKAEINKALGANRVTNVYITNFVLQ